MSTIIWTLSKKMDHYIVNDRIGNDLGLGVSPFNNSVIHCVIIVRTKNMTQILNQSGSESSLTILQIILIWPKLNRIWIHFRTLILSTPVLILFSVLLMSKIVYMLKNAAEQADIFVIISDSTYKKNSKQ